MINLSKWILNVVLGGIILFCMYGFLATFESLAHAIQIKWRLIYGVIFIADIIALVLINRSPAKK